jgi:hypothetical protein
MSRNRDREGAGKSEKSWIKQGQCGTAASGQVAAFRCVCPDEPIVLIDGNAGDGVGVQLRQADLFEGPQFSRSTPKLLSDLADHHQATLCLCDHERAKRRLLAEKFPNAHVVASQQEAAEFAIDNGFKYALWLSDPCGYAGHGVEHMHKVAVQIVRSDFIIVFNEGALLRAVSVAHSPYWRKHQEYAPMLAPSWWQQQLQKRYLARSQLINQSNGFHFRLLVASNFLSDAVRRQRKVEIVQCQEGQPDAD